MTILRRYSFQWIRLNLIKRLNDFGNDKLYKGNVLARNEYFLESIPVHDAWYRWLRSSHTMALCSQSHDLFHKGQEKLEVVWPMFVLIPPITVTLEFYKPHLTEFSSVVMSFHASNICRWLHLCSWVVGARRSSPCALRVLFLGQYNVVLTTEVIKHNTSKRWFIIMLNRK